MSEPPRSLRTPPLEVPVLEWWANDYDHVFAVLNPFFRVPGYTPETAAYGPVRMSATSAEEVVDLVLAGRQKRPNEAPEDFDEIIKTTGVQVRWADIRAALDALNNPLFHRTVWLWVVQADRDDIDQALAAKLTDYCKAEGIYPPDEDQLPAILEPTVSSYLHALDIPEVIVWSEWRETSVVVPSAAFRSDQPTIPHPNGKRSAIEGPGMLLSWEHDDVAGLLCLTDELRDKLDPAQLFEGFWLGPNDYCDIFNPIDLFARRPAVGH